MTISSARSRMAVTMCCLNIREICGVVCLFVYLLTDCHISKARSVVSESRLVSILTNLGCVSGMVVPFFAILLLKLDFGLVYADWCDGPWEFDFGVGGDHGWSLEVMRSVFRSPV
jgi:hypothetical protein